MFLSKTKQNLTKSSPRDWPFNNGECDPEAEGISRCAACCDNTKQAKTRACNLDTYLDKKKGWLQETLVHSQLIDSNSYVRIESTGVFDSRTSNT